MRSEKFETRWKRFEQAIIWNGSGRKVRRIPSQGEHVVVEDGDHTLPCLKLGISIFFISAGSPGLSRVGKQLD